MATGLSVAEANAQLDYLTSNTTNYVQLHTGDPGAAGTANVAAETTRVLATFGTPAAGGSKSNTAALTWSSVAASEDYTHYTVWTAATNGNFKLSGLITAFAVTAGDDFEIAIGDLTLFYPVAS